MSETSQVDVLIEFFPLYSEELGIDLSQPSGRFKWFLASILSGARIGERVAMNTYRCFEGAGVNAPDEIIEAGWDRLVEILDAGGYVRYDFSTASKLLDIMDSLKKRYGSLEGLYSQASSAADVMRLVTEFKGIGPTTAQIFLRELRGMWEVLPPISAIAGKGARNLGINLGQFEGEKLARVETALVKQGLRYCKKRKCAECPVREFCKEKG